MKMAELIKDFGSSAEDSFRIGWNVSQVGLRFIDECSRRIL